MRPIFLWFYGQFFKNFSTEKDCCIRFRNDSSLSFGFLLLFYKCFYFFVDALCIKLIFMKQL